MKKSNKKHSFDLNDNQIKQVLDRYAYCLERYAQSDKEAFAFAFYQSLDIYDKGVLALYSELESSRKVAEIIGCSHDCVCNRINRIRKQATNYINN